MLVEQRGEIPFNVKINPASMGGDKWQLGSWMGTRVLSLFPPSGTLEPARGFVVKFTTEWTYNSHKGVVLYVTFSCKVPEEAVRAVEMALTAYMESVSLPTVHIAQAK